MIRVIQPCPGDVPVDMPGWVCKTPPFGKYSAQRLSKCCSGTFYNITEPVDIDHPAWPVSCGAICRVDQAFDQPNPDYPYEYGEFEKCVFDAGEDGGVLSRQGPNTPDPSISFTTTPTGPWQTKSWVTDDARMTDDSDSVTTEATGTTSGITTGKATETLQSPPATTSPNAAQSIMSKRALQLGVAAAILLQYVQ